MTELHAVHLYLSRRNLQTLLNKLDRVKAGGKSECTLVKQDDVHPVYPATHNPIFVTAVEDEDYYAERQPGFTIDPPKEEDTPCVNPSFPS